MSTTFLVSEEESRLDVGSQTVLTVCLAFTLFELLPGQVEF